MLVFIDSTCTMLNRSTGASPPPNGNALTQPRSLSVIFRTPGHGLAIARSATIPVKVASWPTKSMPSSLRTALRPPSAPTT